MDPDKFKITWMDNNSERWFNFPNEQVEKSDLNEDTKRFLKVGFPEDAAPFLEFGLRNYNGKFNSVYNYYSDYGLANKSKYQWILGSDNNGNIICIDSSDNDSIIILDHEQDFETIQIMNRNISELAASLLLYRNFIRKVKMELGEGAFLDSQFSEKHLIELEQEFQKLNPKFYSESSFWYSELENLRAEID